MSHVEILPSGEKIRKRDVVDDLKELIKRYEFYDDECHRLWKEYEQLEAENDGLKETNKNLLLEIAHLNWKLMKGSAISQKANRRKWGARCS